jgi:phage baseplate assembly protein W
VNDSFVGAGWSFPLRTQATGGVALVRGDRELEEAIWLILSTSPGERPMRPQFGCGLNNFVFAPADSSTASLIVTEVRSALDRWEPRVVVEDVRVDFSSADRGELHIYLTYRRRDSNSPRNLVFPFYVIPSRESATPALEEGA